MIIKISLRNLFRQKRRNLLLGIGIAFGMCLLVMAAALSSGIGDIMLNKLVESFSGHLFVTVQEKDKEAWNIIRDKERMLQVIQDNVDGIKMIREKISAHGKALGKGKALYISVIGVDPDNESFLGIPILSGDLGDMKDPAIENPLALYQTMADKLNVQVGDMVQMRFESLYGQAQTARFTVVAVLEAINPFFNMLTYCPVDRLKPLVGYQPYETNHYQVILERVTDPQRIIEQANRLHEALQPEAAGFLGTVRVGLAEQAANILAIAPEQESRQAFLSHIRIVEGSVKETLEDERTALISEMTAKLLGVHVGDELSLTYETRFEGASQPKLFWVGGIFESNALVTPEMMFIHPEQLYDSVFQLPPKSPVTLAANHELFPLLLKEWELLDRTFSQVDAEKKSRELGLRDWHGAVLNVSTIHEVAEDILKLSQVINLVTIVGIVILFFIIQIGVINTLRMTIRERTREIGTVRAIGMQQGDVRMSFVAEVVLLTLFACLFGIAAAYLLIQIFGAIPLDTHGSEMGFFLMNNRIYFLLNLSDVLKNLTIILAIAFVTAYFPARKAAKLSVVEALRHYE